jgi:catechol 2,3-dioxygenase-like lactoylglutathione lyase family enzyme
MYGEFRATDMKNNWPSHLPVTQFRLARPTMNLSRIVRFYAEGLGLEVIGSFNDHDGFDGVMLGLPGFQYHIEFIFDQRGIPLPPVSAENQLVFYFPDEKTVLDLRRKLKDMGYAEIRPHNPYWAENGICFADPDGWTVILFEGAGILTKNLE